MEQNRIVSLEGLVRALKLASGEYAFLKIMRNARIPKKALEKYALWNDAAYTRIRLASGEAFELVLICYEKDQHSPIHDFNTHRAWIHPVQGQLKSEHYIGTRDGHLEKIGSVLMGPDEFMYMEGFMGIHRIVNIYKGRSMSFNMYAPPVDSWNVYNPETGHAQMQEVKWNAIYDVL